MANIYLVQHCQSEHHINELTGGWTDTPLTALGKKQAEKVAGELRNLGLTKFTLFSSDLKRASMTAEYISKEFSMNMHLCPSLREINNGEATNKTKSWARENMLYESDYLEIDKQTWNGCETPRDLHNRMSQFIDEHLLDIEDDLVIVSHGVAIGYLICSWLGIDADAMRNSFIKGNAGGISCLTVSHLHQRVLTLFNSRTHLRE